MPRIRTIKPGFFRSLTVTELPIPTRLTWIGLWTYADDSGRGVDDARLIKAELWPLDDGYTAKKVEADMCLLAENGSIRRYVVEGRRFFEISEWHHQRIDRPTPSVLPEPSMHLPGILDESSTNPRRALVDASHQEEEEEEEEEEDREKELHASSQKSDERSEAERIVRAWWESKNPKPVAKFIGVVKLIERFIAAGHDPPLVAAALRDAPAQTVGALEFHLNKPTAQHRPGNVERSWRNILEEPNDAGRGKAGAPGDGHRLAPARALEAGA